MGRARGLAVLSIGIALSACALFTDFGGLSDGDGSSKADDANGGAVEAGPSRDGGQAGPDAGADASCGHLLCEDFDDGASVARWKPSLVDGNEPAATMGPDSLAATTAPSSFLVATPAVHYGTEAYLQQVVEIGEKATLRCSFDVRLDTIPGDGVYSVLGIVAAEAPQYHAADLFVRGGGTRLDLVADVDPDAGAGAYVNGMSIGLGQWTNVVVTLQRTPQPVFTLTDGVEVYTMPMSSWPATSKLALRLGLLFGNPYSLDNAALRVRYDSLRCDAL